MIEKPADHDAQACGQCQYVGHRDFIVATPRQCEQAEMTLGQRIAALAGFYDPEQSIVPLGRFTLPGWSGHSMFWLFQCPDCLAQSVDYLHGHRLYLKCSSCGLNLHVEGARFYEEAGLPQPPTKQWIRQEAERLAALYERQ